MTRDELEKQCTVDVYRGATLAVKVTHLPTGMIEVEWNCKSQYKAREACFVRIEARLSLSARDSQ